MTASALVPASGRAGPRFLPRSLPAWRVLAYSTSLLFAVSWTLALGKDVHWDALNYHLYLGFSALHDRFTQDFFAAGPPSYLNPFAYVPLYLMTAAGWPALAIAVAFAAFHAIVLWLTFEIALVAGLRDERMALPVFATLALVLAAVNPILLQGLGSTLTDLSTGVFVVGGWLAIARAVRGGRLAMAIVAGVLCGVAVALKLSNAVFAIAAVPSLALLPGSFGNRMRGMLLFCVACGAAFLAVSLPWSWQLWREFRNPLFPFLNDWFASPEFTTSPLRYERFIPSGWQAFLMRPFEMLSASSTVHTEPRAPDLRYAVLIAGLVGLSVITLLRRAGIASVPARNGSGDDADSKRTLVALLIGLAIAWCLWLAISGNSRYFLPMGCVAGAILALVLQRLYAVWPSVTIYATLLMLAAQAVQFSLGTDWRREGGVWDGPWLRVDVPERLRSEPQLYLSSSFLTGSAIMPYVHPQSGMINIGGFNVIGPHHPGGVRAQVLIDRNIERLRLMVALPPGIVDRASLPSSPTVLNVYVRRLGLGVDPSDCEFLRIEGNLRGERRPAKDIGWKYFIACRLQRAPEARLAYEREVSVVNSIFDRVEDACPNLFQPRRPVTQEYKYWARTYHMGSEMQLFIDEGRVKYFFPLRGGNAIDIGSVPDWQTGPQPFDCSRRTSPAFVNVSQ
jgi:hypothetical protein